MSTIVLRLKKYIDTKHISIAAFEKSVGLGNATFNKTLKTGGAIGTDKLEKILLCYPDINVNWLLTGKGEMIASGTTTTFAKRLDIIVTDIGNACIDDGVEMIAAALGLSKTELFKVTGDDQYPPATLDVRGLIQTFPEINYIWLLAGIGKPYIYEADVAIQKIRDRNYTNYVRRERCQLKSLFQKNGRKIEIQNVPLYDLSATAGLMAILNENYTSPEDYLRVPNMPPVDGAIHVRGDSMTPLLKSGDIVIFKRLVLSLDSILWGQIYILCFDAGGDTFTVVKYIQKSDTPGCIRLVSHNDRYEPKDIPLSSIRALAIVKASITFHTIE